MSDQSFCPIPNTSNVSFNDGLISGRLYSGALLGRTDCCLTVGVIGGSVPCGGHGAPNPRRFHARGQPVRGAHDAWPARLEMLLNNAYSACCSRGHVVLNLCRSGSGSDYFVETFDTQIAEPVAAAGGVQLMVVDTATNDYNEVLHDIKRLSEERRRELVLEAPILIEALLRQLLSLLRSRKCCTCRRRGLVRSPSGRRRCQF